MKKSALGADGDCDCLLSTKPTTPKVSWQYDDLMIVPSGTKGRRTIHSADMNSNQPALLPRPYRTASRISNASKKRNKLATPRRLFPTGETVDRLYYDAKRREVRKRQAKERHSRSAKKFQPLISSLQHLRRRSERTITEAYETALDEYGSFHQDAYERAFLKLYTDITKTTPLEEHYRILWPTISRGKNAATYEDFSNLMMLVFFNGQVDPEERMQVTDPHISRLIYLISKRVNELTLTRQTCTELSRPCLELLQSETRECTFQPTLVSSDPRDVFAKTRTNTQPAFVRLFEIAEKKNKRMCRLRQLKNSKDAERETEDCTFAPRTNKTAFMARYAERTRKLVHRGSPPAVKNVFETLYQKVPMHYRHRAGLAARTKLTSEEKEAEVCTFTPDISKTKNSWQDSKESFNRTKPKGFEESVYRQRAGLVRRMQRQRDVLTGGKPNYSQRYDKRMKKEKQKRKYLKLEQQRLDQKKMEEEATARKQSIELVEKPCYAQSDRENIITPLSSNSNENSQDERLKQENSQKGYYEIELENQEREKSLDQEHLNEHSKSLSTDGPSSDLSPLLQPLYSDDTSSQTKATTSDTPLTVEISTNTGVGRIEIYDKRDISEAVKEFSSKHNLSDTKKQRLEELLLKAVRDEDE